MDNNVQYTLSLRDLLTGKLREADGAAKQLEGTMSAVESVLMAVGVGFGAYKLGEFASDVVDVGSKMETLNNVINYTSLNTADAAQNHEFLKRIIGEYKLPMMETVDGFSQLSAAMIGTSLQGQGARDVFEGVSVASTAMHLSAEKTNAVFYALNNMMSNGTVQAQDLKLQLGNALPGAFGLAAKSMGVTQQEFKKMMEQGQIVSEEFLPRFAAYLKQEFGGAIPVAVESTTAKMTELKNAGLMLKVELFDYFEPAIKKTLDGLVSFMGFISDHKDEIKALAVGIGTAAAAFTAYNVAILAANYGTKIYTVLNAIAIGFDMARAEGLGVVAAAQWALNAAMDANPIGIMITALGVVAAALYYAYEHIQVFRQGIYAVGYFIKEYVSIWIDLFKGLKDIVVGVFTWDVNAINSGLAKVTDVYANGFKRLGQAAKDGWEAGYKPDTEAAADKTTAKPTATGGVTPPKTPTKDITPKGASAPRAVTINISINKMIEKFSINTTNLTESTSKVHEAVSNVLLQAINDSQIVGNI